MVKNEYDMEYNSWFFWNGIYFYFKKKNVIIILKFLLIFLRWIFLKINMKFYDFLREIVVLWVSMILCWSYIIFIVDFLKYIYRIN